MANLTRKSGTLTGNGNATSFNVPLTTIKTLSIYRNTGVDSSGLIVLSYDEINGSFATFCTSYSASSISINRETKQLEVSGGSVSWSPYAQYARLANGKSYKWVAYGE